MLFVSAAEAGGVLTRGSGIGLARGLSPIRPVVGASRGLSPTALEAGRGTRPLGRRFAPGYGSAGYGYGVADDFLPGFAAGVTPGPGPDREDGYRPDIDADRVIMAPPRPCVAPQIIRIGKDRGTAETSHVRVVYGLPGCGRS